jgi:hypothetical protein
MNKSITQDKQNDKHISKSLKICGVNMEQRADIYGDLSKNSMYTNGDLRYTVV